MGSGDSFLQSFPRRRWPYTLSARVPGQHRCISHLHRSQAAVPRTAGSSPQACAGSPWRLSCATAWGRSGVSSSSGSANTDQDPRRTEHSGRGQERGTEVTLKGESWHISTPVEPLCSKVFLRWKTLVLHIRLLYFLGIWFDIKINKCKERVFFFKKTHYWVKRMENRMTSTTQHCCMLYNIHLTTPQTKKHIKCIRMVASDSRNGDKKV